MQVEPLKSALPRQPSGWNLSTTDAAVGHDRAASRVLYPPPPQTRDKPAKPGNHTPNIELGLKRVEMQKAAFRSI